MPAGTPRVKGVTGASALVGARYGASVHTAVLIPARDEGPRIGATIAGVRAALPGVVVVVVDGGSRDDTAVTARQAGAVVVPQGGRGYAGALRAGHEHLLGTAVQRVVQLDADGQHPPADAPRLLALLDDRCHLVIGSRQGTASGGPWSRRVGNRALAVLVRRLTGRVLHDVTSGYWAFDRRALELFVQELPPDCADANVRVMAVRAGLEPRELAVEMALRDDGRSMHDGLAGVRNFAVSVRRTLQAAGRAPQPGAVTR